MSKPYQSSGFSLLEVMTVILIIGLLSSLLLPAVGRAKEEARKMVTANQLRQTALLYLSGRQSGMRVQTYPHDNLNFWMQHMAQRKLLLDPQLLVLEDDPLPLLRQRPIPRQILKTSGDGGVATAELHPDCAGFPFSLVVVTYLYGGVTSGSVPILWTRGLGSDGIWRDADGSDRSGIYSGGGGWIVFMDGRVEYHENLSLDGGQLRDYQTGAPTGDIRRALPPGAVAVDYLGKVF